jgi:acyl-CoA synthetase (NDP forming)
MRAKIRIESGTGKVIVRLADIVTKIDNQGLQYDIAIVRCNVYRVIKVDRDGGVLWTKC